jgi:hypothetical protein
VGPSLCSGAMFYIHMHCNTRHIMLGIYGLHARQSSARLVSEIRHAP